MGSGLGEGVSYRLGLRVAILLHILSMSGGPWVQGSEFVHPSTHLFHKHWLHTHSIQSPFQRSLPSEPLAICE